MNRLKGVVAIVAIVAYGVTTTARAEVIMDADHLNGSFGSPDVDGWQAATPPAGWSVAGGTANQGLVDGGVDVGQYVYWANPSQQTYSDWLWQTGIYTVTASGEQLSMTYYVGGSSSVQDGWIQSYFDIGAAHPASGFASVKGITLGGVGSLQTHAYTTTESDIGKSVGVSFTFSSENYTQLRLDNVIVSVMAVPEPGMMTMLGMVGLFGLLAYAWRTRR